MKLIVMRHAERDDHKGIAERDQPLTRTGEEKAQKAVNGIRDFLNNTKLGLVMTSPYLPAIKTAQILCDSLGIKTLLLANDLAPEAAPKLASVIDLLRPYLQEQAVAIVGHNPQLEQLIKRLSPVSNVRLGRGDSYCLEIDTFDGQMATISAIPLGKPDPPRSGFDRKDIWGMFLAAMALLTFFIGGLLLYLVISSVLVSGEGGISITVKDYGQIKGINGSMLLSFAGLACILVPLGFVRKAYQEAIDKEGGAKDTIRHMSPF